MTTDGPVEPAAQLREFASTLRQMYLALVYEGFTSHEALVVVGQIIAGQRGSQ